MGERREILSKLCDPIPVLTVGSHFFRCLLPSKDWACFFFKYMVK